MKLHEYQARELFKSCGISVNRSRVARTPGEVKEIAKNWDKSVIKAQVLSGGRGKAGGVKLASTPEEAEQRAADILGMDINGYRVEKLLVGSAVDIIREYYLGMVLDRAKQGITMMLTSQGGVDIEDLAARNPDAIHKLTLFIHKKPLDSELDAFLAKVIPEAKLRSQALVTTKGLYKLFVEKDASLVEINPYALTPDNTMLALDGKMVVDDNALYRQEDLVAMINPEESSSDEMEAHEKGLSFVSLDGNIGCVVNGAGLAMATLDLIKNNGGNPANFLDVGGSSNPQKVADALAIILRNKNVKAILINIFGGITRCDDIAKGILIAQKQLKLDMPMVIRLVGTNQGEGRKILEDAGLEAGDSLDEAVESVIRVAKR